VAGGGWRVAGGGRREVGGRRWEAGGGRRADSPYCPIAPFADRVATVPIMMGLNVDVLPAEL
jgi:hypothetical protein